MPSAGNRSATTAGLVTAALVAVALAVAASLHVHARDHARELDRERAELIAGALENELVDVRLTLRAVAGFLGEQVIATPDEFARYHASLPVPAAIGEIAWAPAVARTRLPAYERAAGVRVAAPPAGGAPAPRPPPPVAFPVLYRAPVAAGAPAGAVVDLAGERARLEAATSARATNGFRVSAPVPLTRDGVPGVVFVVPARGPMPGGGNVPGLVLSTAALEDLEAGLALGAPGVAFSVTDGARTIMGDDPPDDAPPGVSLSVAGREWVVRSWGAGETGLVPALLAGGLGTLAALMVGALMLQGARREARVTALVGERTAALAAQAVTDPVSGLANDRAFRRALDARLPASGPLGDRLCVALLDVDGYDGLSDALSTGTGEPPLAEIGARLRASARPGDVLARVGGDEFAWLMPATELGEATAVVERARAAVAASPLPRAGRLTVSAGVACTDGATRIPDLMRHAGAALYWAKSSGRDRVEAFDPSRTADLSLADRARRVERELSLAALRALAQAVDAKDADTRAHSERVARTADGLARAMGWDAVGARRLRDAALVHDIGKIGIPDAILFKPGRLTDDEFATVRAHAALGAEIVEGILDAEQVAWVRHHHERVDGRGYPDGLAGAGVPAGARILAVADSFDVMITVRTYKDARGVEDALAEVRRCAGGQFDEGVVRALGRLWAAGALTGPPGGAAPPGG